MNEQNAGDLIHSPPQTIDNNELKFKLSFNNIKAYTCSHEINKVIDLLKKEVQISFLIIN